MALKLKLNTGKASSPSNSVPPTPGSVSGGVTPSSGTSVKLKLTASQPPTPATEQPAQLKKGNQSASQKSKASAANSRKRAANDDISPAPKRPAPLSAPTRKFSLKGPVSRVADESPLSAGGSNKLLLRRKSTQPRLASFYVKQQAPPRIPGTGYDSEDSDAEEDPAIQQAFVLRMEPGEDCDYLHNAIANGKVGLPPAEGPAEVTMRFMEKENNRRAIVTIRGRRYAAVLVDLPCIVETMKSWDKKGWWKVADICQMLLVLGRCSSDEEAKNYALPREVDKTTFRYAHGLTPPMKWVRKRRFRKRLDYRAVVNVEEEVERLLKEDEITEAGGGDVTMSFEGERDGGRGGGSQIDDEEEGNAIETVENGQEYEEYYDDDDDMADADLEGNLQAMFDEDHANASSDTPAAADVLTESPKPLADQVASFSAVENALALETASPSASAANTPAEDATSDAEDSESDADSDADSPDVLDEDAAAAAAERNQQLEEVADLEREVEAQKRKVENIKNQLLKERAVAQLRTLEEDLRVKRAVLGFGEDDEGGEEGNEG